MKEGEGDPILAKYMGKYEVQRVSKTARARDRKPFLDEPRTIEELARRLVAVAAANRRLWGVGLEDVEVLPVTGPTSSENDGVKEKSSIGNANDCDHNGDEQGDDGRATMCVIGASKFKHIYAPMNAVAHVAKMCIAQSQASELFMKEKENMYSPRDDPRWPRSNLKELYERCRDTLYKHAFVQFGMQNLLRSKKHGGHLSKYELLALEKGDRSRQFFQNLEKRYLEQGKSQSVAPISEDAFASYWEHLPYGGSMSTEEDERMTREKWYPKLRHIAKTIASFANTPFQRKAMLKERLLSLQVRDIKPLPEGPWDDAMAVLVTLRKANRDILEHRVFRYRSGSQAARKVIRLYRNMSKTNESGWEPNSKNSILLGPPESLRESHFAVSGRAAVQALIAEWQSVYAFLPPLDDSASSKSIIASIHEAGLLCKVHVELGIVSRLFCEQI